LKVPNYNLDITMNSLDPKNRLDNLIEFYLNLKGFILCQ